MIIRGGQCGDRQELTKGDGDGVGGSKEGFEDGEENGEEGRVVAIAIHNGVSRGAILSTTPM